MNPIQASSSGAGVETAIRYEAFSRALGEAILAVWPFDHYHVHPHCKASDVILIHVTSPFPRVPVSYLMVWAQIRFGSKPAPNFLSKDGWIEALESVLAEDAATWQSRYTLSLLRDQMPILPADDPGF